MRVSRSWQPGRFAPPTRHRRGDAGHMTLAVIVIGLLLVVGIGVGSLIMSAVFAERGARSAADLSALAAATEATETLGDDGPCAVAGQVAADNGARVVACEIVRAGSEVAVKIEVAATPHWTMPGLPQTVAAVSYAGNPG